MKIKTNPTLLVACGLAALPILVGGRVARADSYPTQGTQNFRAEGVVTMVDADRDRVTIKTSDGHEYNLDTDNSQIKLRDTDRPGDTSDLVNGMHVSISGRLLSSNIVAVDSLSVLPYNGPVDAPPPSDDQPPVDEQPDQPAQPEQPAPSDQPVAPVAPRPIGPAHPSSDRIRLRGTVENVDDDNGVVVVRVNTHLRTVLVDHNTNLTDIPSPDDNHIGVRPGDRITVLGVLTQDGNVRASAISLSKNLGAAEKAANAVPTAPDVDNAHQLVGRISHPADPFLNRDIKVVLDEGREVTVHVPHEARVMRDGRPISVHDLTGDDVVRVIGSYDGDTFKATRVDVLQVYGEQ